MKRRNFMQQTALATASLFTAGAATAAINKENNFMSAADQAFSFELCHP